MGYWRKKGLTFLKPEEVKAILKDFKAPYPHQQSYRGRKDEVSVSGYDAMATENSKYVQPQPTARSATEENFQRLSDNIDVLDDSLDRLQGKIDPILADSTPSVAEDKRAGYPSPTKLSERMATLCSRTDDLIDRVKYLTARIDL